MLPRCSLSTHSVQNVFAIVSNSHHKQWTLRTPTEQANARQLLHSLRAFLDMCGWIFYSASRSPLRVVSRWSSQTTRMSKCKSVPQAGAPPNVNVGQPPVHSIHSSRGTRIMSFGYVAEMLVAHSFSRRCFKFTPQANRWKTTPDAIEKCCSSRRRQQRLTSPRSTPSTPTAARKAKCNNENEKCQRTQP